MTKTNLLKSKMTLKGLTIQDIANLLNLSYFQTQKKINNNAQFNQTELKKIKEKLELSDEEIISIFFN